MTLPEAPLRNVPIDRIDFDDRRFQIRLDPRSGNLLDSLRRDGQLVPVVLQAQGGRFRVIDGHRRCEVLRRLGAENVRAMALPVSDAEALRLAFVFNHARKTLLPVDRWNSLRRMAHDLGWSNARIAEATGLHADSVSRLRRLFPDMPLVDEGLAEGWLRPSHLRALRSLVPRDRWPAWLRRIREERMPGRRLYEAVAAAERRREPPYVTREPDGVVIFRGFRFAPATADAREMWRAIAQYDAGMDRVRSWLRRSGETRK
ncbi:MAG: ParB/RepB/Spo0J family partition protein [Myxococcota bacterium]